MKAVLKRIGLIFLIAPFVLLFLLIVYEIIGAVVNQISTDYQTRDVIELIEEYDVEILDEYSFTGNSSGTGNHVDMLTLVVIKTDNIIGLEDDIEDKGLFFQPLPNLDEPSSFKNHLKDMELPDNTDNCYLVWKCSSAPFPNNIMGH